MKRLALVTVLALAALAVFLSFAPTGQARAPSGGPCPQGDPLDFDQGYRADIAAPIAIPDNSPAGLDNCMFVPAKQEITGLEVSVNITHSYVGDLFISLYHATSGTTVVLLDRPGVPVTPNGCAGDNIRVTFSDGAAAPVESQCAPAPPAIYGTFRPQQALSAFSGDTFGGQWRLYVSDGAAADTGTLDSWSLRPTYAAAGGNGDVNCSGSADAIDATLILQIAAGFNFPLPCGEEGDVNDNGMLDAIDATLVLQYAAGLLLTLPPPPPLT